MLWELASWRQWVHSNSFLRVMKAAEFMLIEKWRFTSRCLHLSSNPSWLCYVIGCFWHSEIRVPSHNGLNDKKRPQATLTIPSNTPSLGSSSLNLLEKNFLLPIFWPGYVSLRVIQQKYCYLSYFSVVVDTTPWPRQLLEEGVYFDK